MIVVSVIIPIYKSEEYIIGCIDSVLNQDYRKLEIILVDDCSPDKSLEIARNHIVESPKNKDIVVKYKIHEVNRGQAAARNTGINEATGDYIYFLDSDDEITADCIDSLVQNSDNGRIDVICGAFKVIGNEQSLWHKYKFKNTFITGNHNIVKYYTSNGLYDMACNKMVRREIVLANKLFFKEGIIHEDTHWSFLLVNHIETQKTISKVGYLYYHRDNSTTSSPVNIRYRLDSYIKILESFNEAETNGMICAYCECLRYIDNYKVLWLRKILDSRIFSFNEKIQYLKRVLKLNRTDRMVWGYLKSVVKGWYYRIIDILVLLRERVYMLPGKS